MRAITIVDDDVVVLLLSLEEEQEEKLPSCCSMTPMPELPTFVVMASREGVREIIINLYIDRR